MYFTALATDYDGTLATEGAVGEETLEALAVFKETGRRLILVTGRELPELKLVFPQLSLFDRVVAENGALLYTPATEEERDIAPAPPPGFVERLRRKGVDRISVGRSIIATWEPHQTAALEAINEMGLELEIVFNKGAVMILPTGVNKASGLAQALSEMELSPLNVVGVGDAENDHALLRACGCGAAVANAIAALKDTADIVLHHARSAGVVELMRLVAEHDILLAKSDRHVLRVAGAEGGDDIPIRAEDVVLIAEEASAGRSAHAVALTDRMKEQAMQFCIFDPQGRYDGLEGAVTIGDASAPPSAHEVLKLLEKAKTSVVVNAQGCAPAELASFFADLMASIARLRAETGRPHWMIVDEADRPMPAGRAGLPGGASGIIMASARPNAISKSALKTATRVVAFGPQAAELVREIAFNAGTRSTFAS